MNINENGEVTNLIIETSMQPNTGRLSPKPPHIRVSERRMLPAHSPISTGPKKSLLVNTTASKKRDSLMQVETIYDSISSVSEHSEQSISDVESEFKKASTHQFKNLESSIDSLPKDKEKVPE